MGQDKGKRYENCILALAVTGISALLMACCFDFYFDLNDDTMMRDIMAGIYSGVPDGHNMQTLYPLGALLALCYRLCRGIPWYGLFLFLCQFGCLFLVGVRLCGLTDTFSAMRVSRWRKLAGLLGVNTVMWGTWLTHMVNVQYTITCAMLCGAAVFWFMTTPRERSGRSFLIFNIPSILLLTAAFQLRSEMLLLTLPFMAFAMWYRWWEEKPLLALEKLKKYGAVAVFLVLGMALSLLIDSAAYSSGEWRDFRRFFDARTTVYDFYQEVVTQDGYQDALAGLGVSPAQQMLLRNYNFGLDEEIDTGLLEKVAAYARDSVGGARDWGRIFRDSLFTYRYRTLHLDDAPYNLLVLFGYAANIISIVILFLPGGRSLRQAAQLVLLVLMRSALWMFILMRGRDPERITHSLYLVEFFLLAGIFFWNFGDIERRRGRFLLGGAAVSLLLLSLGSLPMSLRTVRQDQGRREEIQRDWQAIDDYCRAHPGNFYLEDVYSTVAFSGKLFGMGEGTCANYDIAGGWMCKSPLQREKLSLFGLETAQEALTENGVYFIMSDAEKGERGLAWLTDFYGEKGMETEVEESDRINGNYGVYQVFVRE